jgi:DNA-binding response OmpR family regulator
VTTQFLVREVWGQGAGTHNLRTFVHQIREKLGEDSGLIVNDPGVGYRIESPDDA